jgi:hypothetical protein
MKAKTLRALRFLRVTDETNNLSLTNVAMVVVLVNIVQRPEVSLQDLLAFVGAMVGYQFKRFVNGAAATPEQDAADLRAEIDSLKTKVTALVYQSTLPRR